LEIKEIMNCPNCLKTKLEKTERLGFHFKYCPTCNGMWFDRVELNKVLDRILTDQHLESTKKQDNNSTSILHELDSAITKQIYDNREMHFHHNHPRRRHWLHRLFE